MKVSQKRRYRFIVNRLDCASEQLVILKSPLAFAKNPRPSNSGIRQKSNNGPGARNCIPKVLWIIITCIKLLAITVHREPELAQQIIDDYRLPLFLPGVGDEH